MIGTNKIELNYETLLLAVENYLNSTMSVQGKKVTAEVITFKGYGTTATGDCSFSFTKPETSLEPEEHY